MNDENQIETIKRPTNGKIAAERRGTSYVNVERTMLIGFFCLVLINRNIGVTVATSTRVFARLKIG